MLFKYEPLEYLLADRRPAWVKYQTYVRILGKPQDDPDLVRWKEERDASAVVREIRERQNDDGSFACMPWIHVHRYYFHQMLEMGYGLEDPTVRKSADNLLNYQLPGGGYRHPHAKMIDPSTSPDRWTPCVTGYVTKALMDLGLTNHPSVRRALRVMHEGQKDSGGWICDHVGKRAPYCIWSGTPWVFACLAHAGLINKTHALTKRAVALFSRHKDKIIRHGYHCDHYYRCDETLLIPALRAVGLTPRHALLADLCESLLEKQQPDGSWRFGGRPRPDSQRLDSASEVTPSHTLPPRRQHFVRLYSAREVTAWYTIEAVAALMSVGRV